MAIKRCNCKNEEQDKLHGKGRRVYTQSSTKGSGEVKTAKGASKCTVCGKESR